MNAPCITITAADDLAALTAAASRHPCGTGAVELLRAVSEKRIALALVLNRRATWTPRLLKSSLPTVCLLGDDAGDSRNPDEWRAGISVIAWARSAIVHGTGASAETYREAIRGAEATGRCLLVETDSAHVNAWVRAIAPREIPVLICIPPKGGQHPITAGSAGQ
jgi:hypothetical protein